MSKAYFDPTLIDELYIYNNIMSEKILTYEEDFERLGKMDLKKLLELFMIQIKNIWRVDGLYFQGIEKRFGVDSAEEIDRETWSILAKIEARDLKKLYDIEEIRNIREFMELLLNTSWAIYQSKKSYYIDEENGIGVFKVISCRVQEARIKKGLGVFPCKNVRYIYLRSFAEAVDPNIEVEVVTCPPDEKPPDYWCAWRFKLKKVYR